MLIIIVQVLLIVFMFVFIYYNHLRISNVKVNNNEFYNDAKKKLHALNNVMLQKFEKKQNIDSKIMELIIKKVDQFEKHFSSKDESLEAEVNSLKRTLKYLQDQKTLFHNFSEEEI